jgi:lipopolysaccharide/colanic/teichoic acid biosynthesis glycosyltransferase
MSTKSEFLKQHGISDDRRWRPYRSVAKRCFDLLVCVVLLVLAAPVFFLAAVLIRLDSQGPVLFVQQRLGRFGSTFPTFKFRTMTDRPRVATAEVLPGHSEVTRVGHWLRRFKIDELPQLLNILRGDMSLIGPRPALPEHIAEYNDDGLCRLLERPGLTGLAQISGNIYLSWPDRWILDARYVQTVSFATDIGIAFKTVAVVFVGEEKFVRPVIKFPTPETHDENAQQQTNAASESDDRKVA